MSGNETDIDGPPRWYQEIFPGGERNGFYEKLTDHALLFVERDPDILVVTFDNLSDAGGRHLAREPWAGKFVADKGWSHFSVFSKGPLWYRDAQLISRLEALRDTGLFTRFKRVVFCGTSMGGFAALTFSQLVPGAVVIAFSPQSSLDTAIVPWETRFRKGQVQDWTLPYSDAAKGLETAQKAYVIYDPFVTQDALHAERLSADTVMRLHAPGCGHKSAFALRRMDSLKDIMTAAITDHLTPTSFAQLIRGRKEIYLYKQTMQQHLRDRNQEDRALRFGAAFKARRQKNKA